MIAVIEIPAPAIVGTTRLIGIVGDPIAQVRSPEIYNPRLARARADAVLVPLHVPAAAFDEVLPGLMKLANLTGLIFTVPFKERAMRYAGTVLPSGREAGAINAMRRASANEWIGDIFDGAGLVRALGKRGVSAAGKRVALLGAGGAGRAIALALAASGAASLTLVDIDQGKAARLAADTSRVHPACATHTGRTCRAVDVDIVINATPVGMAPGDGLPADLGDLRAELVVFDIISKPAVTPLLGAAREAGCVVLGGAAMIESQADAVLDFLGFPTAQI